MTPEKYVPLSVRYGGRRERFGWWVSTQRERLAVRLAPWLKPRYGGYRAITFEGSKTAPRVGCAADHGGCLCNGMLDCVHDNRLERAAEALFWCAPWELDGYQPPKSMEDARKLAAYVLTESEARL